MFPPFTFFSLRYVLVHPLVFVVRSFGEKTEKKKGREEAKEKKRKEKKREEGKRKETEEGRGREKKRGREHFFFCVSSDRIVLRLPLGLLFFMGLPDGSCIPELFPSNCCTSHHQLSNE